MTQYLIFKSQKNKFIILFITFGLFSFSTHAQKISSEDKIKASYVFNFVRFITWPSQGLNKKKQSVQVCSINQNNRFDKAFKPVIGKKISGQPLMFKKIKDIEHISQCHLLYIDKSEKEQIHSLLPLIKKYRILSISDSHNFCALGGIIGMVKRKGRIRIEINLKEAKSAGFKISSNLLEVATIVNQH